MISNFLRPLIFHILFTTAIGNISIKILHINLSNAMGDNLYCDSSYSGNNSDVLDFIRSRKPDVVLLSINCKADTFLKTIENLRLNIILLPIPTNDKRNELCFELPTTGLPTNCFYSKPFSNSKLRFLILNTELWTKESIASNEQFRWLTNTLIKSEMEQKHVIVVGFKSPGSLEVSNGSLNYAQQYNQKLVELFVKYSKTIKGCLFGNEQVDAFRIILNKERKPILPIFIAPLSRDKLIRMYTYNQTINELDNYAVYQKLKSGVWKEKFNCRNAYGLANMNANSWGKLAQSFLNNNTRMFQTYFDNLLTNKSDPFKKYCESANLTFRTNCRKCRSHCFIINLTKRYLDNCLKRCSLLIVGVGNLEGSVDVEHNNGLFYVFTVIAGFVIILLGIVLAVNKVYCIRRGRQRNIFLAPLTLNIQSETIDDNLNPDLNSKAADSKEDIESNNQTKNSNGFRRTNHEVEQTYNYIRM